MQKWLGHTGRRSSAKYEQDFIKCAFINQRVVNAITNFSISSKGITYEAEWLRENNHFILRN